MNADQLNNLSSIPLCSGSGTDEWMDDAIRWGVAEIERLREAPPTHRDIGRFWIDTHREEPALTCSCSAEPVLHLDGHSLGDVLIAAEEHRCEAGP